MVRYFLNIYMGVSHFGSIVFRHNLCLVIFQRITMWLMNYDIIINYIYYFINVIIFSYKL